MPWPLRMIAYIAIILVAFTAATAAAPATVSTTTTAASAVSTTAAATCAGTCFAGFGFIDGESAAAVILAVHRGDRFGRFFIVPIWTKPKPLLRPVSRS